MENNQKNLKLKLYDAEKIQKEIDNIKESNTLLVSEKDFKNLELRLLNLELNMANLQDKFKSYYL